MKKGCKSRQASDSVRRGAIAQLGERIVRNDEVVGSSPTSSTKFHVLTVPTLPEIHHFETAPI